MNEFREARTGIYFLCKDLQVVYVGQSCDVSKRLEQHKWTKDFDSALMMLVPPDLLNEVERYWIERIKPRLNLPYREDIKAEARRNSPMPVEHEAEKPSQWGSYEDTYRMFGLRKGMLNKLAFQKRIKCKEGNKKGSRLFDLASIRELLEANVS